MTPKQVFYGTLVVLVTLLGAVFFYKVLSVLILLVIAIIFASAISPVVARVNQKLPLSLSIALVYVILILVAIGLVGTVIPTFIKEVNALVNAGPHLLTDLQVRINQIQSTLRLPGNIQLPNIQSSANKLLSQAPGFLKSFISALTSVASSIVSLTVMLVFAFYWLLEREHIKRTWVVLLPADKQNEAYEIIDEIETRLGGYVRGQVTVAVTVAILAFAGLSALQIKFALVLAIFSGIAELIPVAGPFIGAAPALLVALSTSSPLKAFFVLAMFWIIQQLESQLLIPKILQRYVKLSPLTVLFVVLAGIAVLGPIGAIVAVPVASAINVMLQHTLLRPKVATPEGETNLIITARSPSREED